MKTQFTIDFGPATLGAREKLLRATTLPEAELWPLTVKKIHERCEKIVNADLESKCGNACTLIDLRWRGRGEERRLLIGSRDRNYHSKKLFQFESSTDVRRLRAIVNELHEKYLI